MKKDLWLSTDECVEAVLSLEMMSDILPKVPNNIHYWKWVLIALHNALQGYMVLALKGTSGLNILKKECAQEWIAALRRDDEVLPERKLDNFLNLYKKIQAGRKLYDEQLKAGHILPGKSSDLMMMYVHSQPFKPRGTQTESVRMLNELRNDYIHFLPKGLLLGVHRLPRVVDDCLNIIDFLAFECGNILWHDPNLKTKTKELIRQAKSHLATLNESYGT
jgi:hypothetical protein